MARPQNGVNGNIQQQHFGYLPHGFNISTQIPRNQSQGIFGYSDLPQVVPSHFVPQVYSTSLNQNVANTMRPASPMVNQTQYAIYQYPPTYPQSSQINQFQFQTNYTQTQQYAYPQDISTTAHTNYITTRRHQPLVVVDPINNTDLDLSKFQNHVTTTATTKISSISKSDKSEIVSEHENKSKLDFVNDDKSKESNDDSKIINESLKCKPSNYDETVENIIQEADELKIIKECSDIIEVKLNKIQEPIEIVEIEDDYNTQSSNNEEESIPLTVESSTPNYFLHINQKESDETTLRKKLIYDREYLVSIKGNSQSQKKPANLPSGNHFSEDIIYNESRNISCKRPINSQSILSSSIKRQPSKPQGNNYKKMSHFSQFHPKLINLDHNESQVFERLKSSYLPPQLRCKEKDMDPYTELKRNIKCNLNKITPQNFQECLAEINKLNIKEKEEMTCLINEIFIKAVQEEAYSVTYAQFCNKLAQVYVENQSFKSQLLKKCQDMFQTPIQEQLDNVKKEWMLKIDNENEPKIKILYESDLEEQLKKAKDRYFGNIRFIGELFLHNLLAGKVITNCICELLKSSTDSDALLALCKLMETCGKQIDVRNHDQMNNFIKKMDELSKSSDLETRIRFKLKDIVDMRNRKWTLRHIQQEKKINPKTLEEQKEEAVAEAAIAASKLIAFQANIKKNHSVVQPNIIRRQVSAPHRTIAFKNLSCTSHIVDEKMILGPVRSNWTAGSGSKSKQKDAEGWIPTPQKSTILTRSREPSPQVKRANKYRTLESSAEVVAVDSRPSSPPVVSCPHTLTKAYRIKKEVVLSISDEERADIIFSDLLLKGVFDIESWIKIRNYKPILEKWIDNMMEKDDSCRRIVGDSFNSLLREKIITHGQLIEGCHTFISCADDLIYDIPKLWEFFSQFLESFICDQNSDISFFMDIFKPLLPNKDVAYCISLTLHAASSRLGHKIVGQVFRKSSLQWQYIIPKDIEIFIERNQLTFTLRDVDSSDFCTGSSLQSISLEIENMLSQELSNEHIFDYLEKHIDKVTWESTECSKTITTSILKAMENIPKSTVKHYLKDKSKIIKQISQNKIENEIEILKSILLVAGNLDKETLTFIYDVIMTGNVISYAAFDCYLEDASCKAEPNFDVTYQIICQLYNCG